MGVLNVTPDSFYDGGRYSNAESIAERVVDLVREGADIIDVGGESTRPRADPVPATEQIARVEGAVRAAVESGALVSIDTGSPEVAERALSLGASIVNDVTCLADPELAAVSARFGAVLIVMHSRGPMQRMAGFSQYAEDGYGDVVEDVLSEWRSARDRAVAAGMPESQVWLDPGIGFAKSARQSYALLTGLERLCGEGVPVVVGASRKSFISAADAAPPEKRLAGSLAAGLSAASRGAAVLRVHDVGEMRQALAVERAIRLGLAPAPQGSAGVQHA
ncbi:MAG: dihydropteroate synthase [Myxococcota bacterium]|jgi:dihydropteroate synthase|nr:dihydropteroate synthase [Myxococcota bacterium]